MSRNAKGIPPPATIFGIGTISLLGIVGLLSFGRWVFRPYFQRTKMETAAAYGDFLFEAELEKQGIAANSGVEVHQVKQAQIG